MAGYLQDLQLLAGANESLLTITDPDLQGDADEGPEVYMSKPTLAAMMLLNQSISGDDKTADIPTTVVADINLGQRRSFKEQSSHSTTEASAAPLGMSLAFPFQVQSVPYRPALPTRSTQDVITDLKRPSHNMKHSEALLAADLIGNPTINSELGSVEAAALGKPSVEEEERNEEGSADNNSEGEEDLGSTGPGNHVRKISERKRLQYVIADRFIQETQLKSIKTSLKLVAEDEENQSTRMLVKQTENINIISTPRTYQLELFERAKERNTIAVLETGSGKTLIAVLLLRHVLAQELEDRANKQPPRISFFLVDSVALLFQQHAVLKANLDQPMDMFCGDMGCDSWKPEVWTKHFSKNMVIVCTADLLRHCLHHSHISMSQINLLIFDEAHHAKKGHAYARIIKDFYAQEENHDIRPRIFGMTASPVDARTDVKKAAAELEGLLHSQIATAKDGNLDGFKTNSRQEITAIYHRLWPVSETPLYLQMLEHFKDNMLFGKPLRYVRDVASCELGSWCADHFLSCCLQDEECKKLLAKTEQKYHETKPLEPIEVLESRCSKIRQAADIVKQHPFELPDFVYIPNASISNNLSPKVVCLVEYLKDRFERLTDDKAIIFVKQRYTASLLARLFSFSNIGTPHLRVGTLVGTRTGDVGDSNRSFREQIVTLRKFRKGDINCLFATSVAEEGLDIPDCNLVIRFDLYSTLIEYIQSRGRARQVNSRYIHMYEHGNEEHRRTIQEMRLNEGILEKFCRQLPEDRLISGGDFNMEHFLTKEKGFRTYTVPKTKAKLTYGLSLVIVANFVASLPHKQDHLLKPEYLVTTQNKQFVCEVLLPESSPIRGALGRPASTKQVAKFSAAFDTCLLLRKGNYLDEYLNPIYSKQLPTMRNALLAINSKKRKRYDMRTKPISWALSGIPQKVFVTILSLESPGSLERPSQPLALLTKEVLPPLPSFYLHFGGGKHSPVRIASSSVRLDISEVQLSQINTFTLCIFEDVFSKKYEPNLAKMPYFLAPIKSHEFSTSLLGVSDLICWDILQSVADHQSQWANNSWENKAWRDAPDNLLQDRYVVDPFDGSRKFYTIGVAPQYKPLDPVPPNTAPRKGPRKNNDNILEYSCSLWTKARALRKFNENQRVVAAKYVSLNRNLLDDSRSSDVEASMDCCIVLEPLKISPLPTKVVAMAYLFPAIIHRMESYLIALEGCASVQLEIPAGLALECFTKDSDNSEEHDSEKVNFQKGMGNNYERLEFLGDCFLKMATSISLYGLLPHFDEFGFHVERMVLICNANLCKNAIKLKLYEFIRSQAFNRRAWYPEGLVLKRGKAATAPNSHDLGDKTIADVCEAMIGAALITGQDSGNMDLAVRAVTELVASENHNATKWSDYYKLYEKPKYQLAEATEAQKDLARQVEATHSYHFKYPRILRSAFIHPSYPFSYEHIPSYQRLEFLGDSLLDMACINFLFHNHPGSDPQWLTEHKMAMVSNQFLGALCVALGWHRHLLLFNSKFVSQITDYVSEITEARILAEKDAVGTGLPKEAYARDYWTSIRHPPKCLPDIVEAYVGAMFVDAEYDYSEVERFFDEHIKHFFVDMTIYDSYANKQPTTFLQRFLQDNMGCMDWSVFPRAVPAIDGSKPRVMAFVMIHDKVISHFEAESNRYAKVGAAKKAVALLEGLPLPEFRAAYGCTCRPEDLQETNEGKVDFTPEQQA